MTCFVMEQLLCPLHLKLKYTGKNHLGVGGRMHRQGLPELNTQ